MTEELDLIIGKPVLGDSDKKTKSDIATFTRFTLPFAFRLQSVTSDKDFDRSLYFEPKNKTDLSFIKRRKYFTRETAETMYDRAQWLSVCPHWDQTEWGKGNVEVILRDQSFKIGMLPPQIVLFELPKIQPQEKANILQTGFLYVDVYFNGTQKIQPQLDDLLVLNEFFRYFGIPYDYHATIFKKIFAKVPVKNDGSQTIGELDELSCYFERWASLLEIPLRFNNQYYCFFPQNWSSAARDWMYNKGVDHDYEADHWQIYADNRCFVWTVAFLKNGGQSLQESFKPDKTMLAAADYGHWIKLLNVDSPPFDGEKYKTPKDTHITVTKFEREWVIPRTYARWEDSGTWYGFCFHAAAILGRPSSFIFGPSATYYFDATVLLLYFRMTLFRFERSFAKAVKGQANKSEKQLREKLKPLRRQFSEFAMLYRFLRFSNQQQAVEMNQINRKFVASDQFFEDMQQEIRHTYEFLESVESNRLANAANLLANWGIPIAACGLVAALFSMVDLKIWQCFSQNCTANANQVFQIVIVIVIGLFIGLILPRLLNSKTKK